MTHREKRNPEGVAGATKRNDTGGRLVTVDGRVLPLRGVAIAADAGGGLARVRLEQRFVNPYPEPLRVTYQVPLPVEGALAGYTIRIGDRRIVGEVDRLAAARERFEDALLEGHTAGLVEQDRTNLFTQELGNVPPGVEVVVELQVDQRLQWLDDGAWEWRFPTVVAPRYLGDAGRVGDADRVTVDVHEGKGPVAARAAITVRDRLGDGCRPESPSHALLIIAADDAHTVTLGDPDGASTVALDRDLVVRWTAASSELTPSLRVGRPGNGRPHAVCAYGLLSVVPPAAGREAPALARDLIVLLDTSGSMSGLPLEQARRVVAALIDSLTDADRLELIEYSNEPRRWKSGPVSATASTRQAAQRWLGGLAAGGGTEMRKGVAEALRPLRSGAQRQVVLVTDGLVGFEREIVETIVRELPAGSRLHAVAVGSAPSRALTAPAARAGRGIEVVVGLDEVRGAAAGEPSEALKPVRGAAAGEPSEASKPDVQAAVARVLAATRAPLLTEVEISGSALVDHAPARLPDVYAGAPLRAAVRLRPDGGELLVHGKTAEGAWEQRIDAAPLAFGEGDPAVVSLYGRETVEDLEMRIAAGLADGEADATIERLGLEFQIATRLTSWVAVSEEATVDPTQPLRRERIPQALPYGMSAEGLGLRSATAPAMAAPALACHLVSRTSFVAEASGSVPGRLRSMASDIRKSVARRLGSLELGESLGVTPSPSAPAPPVARLVRRAGRELHFEITLDHPLDWAPRSVDVIWPDGTRSTPTVIEKHTTRSGKYQTSQVLRLSVRLGAEPPSPEAPLRLEISSGTAVTVIPVRT